jgi:Cu-Zn family superoxide dismutase
MKKTPLLSMLLIAACGGSSKDSTTPQPAVAETEETPDMAAMANPAAPMPPPVEQTEPTTGEPTDPMKPIETAPPVQVEPPEQQTTTAVAMLTTVKDGKDAGMVTFELGESNQITIRGEFNNLTPGPHALYIHEGGDCNDGGKKIGKHLDPTRSKHGPPSSATRHAGDFGDIIADKAGNATFEMTTDSLSFEPGRADTLTGRAIVVHIKKDSKSGNAGGALACGVITMKP